MLTVRMMLSVLPVLLTGCVSTPYYQTADEVSGKLQVETGYEGCRKCDKVKTYSIALPSINKFFGVDREGGWLTAGARLQWTNNQPDNQWGFQLVFNHVNNGFFTNGINYWVSNEAGSLITPLFAKQSDGRCFSNIGSGCRWTDTISIPVSYLLGAANTQTNFYVFVGKVTQETIVLNDGYKPFETYKTKKHGVLYRIPAHAIQGFLSGLSNQGVNVAQIADVQNDLNAKKLRIQLEKLQEKNRKTINLINPLPLNVANDWISKQSEGATICSYLQGTYQRAIGTNYYGIPLYGSGIPTTFRVTASFEKYNRSNKKIKVQINRITANALGEDFSIETLNTSNETLRVNQSSWSDLSGWKTCQP